MKRSKFTKVNALFLVFALLLAATFVPNSVNADDFDIQAVANLERTATPNELEFDEEIGTNNEIELNYTVEFDPVAVEDVVAPTVPKEVVLIIDTSGSMQYDVNGAYEGTSRMTLVKSAANAFIAKLNDVDNVKLSLIEYNTKAYAYTFGGDALADVNDNYASMIQKVNGLYANGGTNIGDAMRQAYFVLNQGNSEAQKYVVMLTDGEPTGFSVDSITVDTTNYWQYAIGEYYYYSGSNSAYVKSYRNVNYKVDAGSPSKYFVNWYSDNSNTSLNYAYAIADMFSLTDVQSDYIAFSDVLAANKLDGIAARAGAVAHESYNETTINEIYSDIADKITTEVALTEVRYEETLPIGMTYIDSELELSVDGQYMSYDFKDVVFKLSEDGKNYVAEPITFAVTVAPEAVGEYYIGLEKTAGIHYIDLDGNITHQFFDPILISVNEMTNPDLKPNTYLNILEVQPGFNYELNKTDLTEALEGYTVSLTQMSMSQFVGTIEEINGKYDIVYFGATDTFTNYTMTGAGDNSVKIDIDITDRRAARVLEFIDSGQVMVMDSEIFGLTNTKLASNFTPIRGKSNVHEVSSASQNEFYANLDEWYANANHRPRLTVNSKPLAYDGTEASFASNHSMGYLYSAFSELDNDMQVVLFVDVNGDGVFSDAERMTDKTISSNRVDLALNYSLDDTFNGLMPWKFELIDSVTNTKDYIKGFTAFEGTKTVVNVLQLSPGTNRMNIDSDTFKLPLNTDDYEINITFMQVSDFDAYYPEAVNGAPTLLNGNYDMIIFGFGDSYAGSVNGSHTNKDLYSEAAIDAIDEFIQTGQSILYTHDTAGPQDWDNNNDMYSSTKSYNQQVNYKDAPNITANFKDDMGFANVRTYAGKGMWRAWSSTYAYKLNDGLITMYPYVLADNATNTLDIATTHDQYWNIDLEQEEVVPWFTLDAGNFKYFPEAYYYTFTNGNITYSGTGHSTPNGVEEQEFFVNTMLKASRGANHAPTLEVVDLYEGMNIPPTEKTIEFKLKIHDIDTLDTIFNTEVYVVLEDGTEIQVIQKGDMEKEVSTKLSFNKPAALSDSVEAFTIKIIVEDAKGAQGMEEIEVTHIEVPTLEVSADVTGYLVGDTFEVAYGISTVDPENEKYVSDIQLSSMIDSAYIQVTDYTGWSLNNKKYSITPVFDDPDTSENEAITDFALEMFAKAEGTFNMILAGSYDVNFVEGGDELDDQTYERMTPIDIKSGQINVEILDNLDRPVEGASVIVKENGVTIVTGTTTETGVYTFEDVKTGVYTVEVIVPEGFEDPDVTTKEVTLEYGDGQADNYIKNIIFSAKDAHAPIISTSYEDGIVIITDLNLAEGEAYSTPVHVKLDGNNSVLVEYSYMVLPDSFVGEMTPEKYKAIGGSTSLSADSGSPFTLDPLKLAGIEKLVTFEVTENGTFVVFAKNAAGNMSIKVIEIKNIIPELPDNI